MDTTTQTQPTTEELLAIIANLQSTVQSMQANHNANSITANSDYDVLDMLQANMIAGIKDRTRMREYRKEHVVKGAVLDIISIVGSTASIISNYADENFIDSALACERKLYEARFGRGM